MSQQNLQSKNISEIIIEIIDKLKSKIPPITDDDIIHFLQEFSKYNQPNNRVPIGSSKPYQIENFRDNKAYHCAYLYRYFTSFAHAIKENWLIHYEDNKKLLNTILSNNSIKKNISCIGGGPATDIIGFQLFLSTIGLNIDLNATILDMEDWETEIDEILTCFDPKSIDNVTFIQYDFFEEMNSNSDVYNNLKNADIISMVEFLSDFSHDKRWDKDVKTLLWSNGVYTKLKRLFEVLKPGAIVFYLDCGGGGYTFEFDRAAKIKGLTKLSKLNSNFDVRAYEINSFLFGKYSPIREMKICSSLWQKPL